MTPTIKMIIGVALLLVGIWVVWSGYNEGETLTMVLGAASLLGGVAFIAFSKRGGVRPLT